MMKPFQSVTAILLFVPVLHAQTQTAFPSLAADPRAEEYARRGTYTWEDLAEISLWASAEGTGAAFETIRKAAAELGATPDLPAGPKLRGEYILGFMHKKLLRSYSPLQTRMDTLLANGRFNCVSSAVLYLILAKASGLEARGVMTRDHAFISVLAGDQWIDVETTNAYGFDPGNRKDFHDQFGKVTGFAYVPAGNYRERKTISPLELVSLILSNRIADLESRGRFGEAVSLALNRAALLAGSEEADSPFFEDPRQDLINRVFNFGASLLNAGKEEDALKWAALAGAKYPDGERWQEFVFAAVNNRVAKFIQQRRLSEARAFLLNNASILSPANYRALDAVVLDGELTELSAAVTKAEDVPPVLAAIDLARSLLPDQRIGELRTFVIGKASSFFASGRNPDWPAAIAYLEAALEQYGANRQLEQALRIYRSNLAAEYHNRFAAAYNKRNFDEAERILAEALELFPDNRQLLEDRRTVEKWGR
ncbi:MAG: hypothetical protein LBD47_08535 [Treponema sp.]|jgi:tetratricopeptide (TPR) repeat protein|nr:hypothetical protein [Treponema sp.]